MSGSSAERQLGVHLGQMHRLTPISNSSSELFRTQGLEQTISLSYGAIPATSTHRDQGATHSPQLSKSRSSSSVLRQLRDYIFTNTLLRQYSAMDWNIPPLRLPCYIKVPRKSADTWPSPTSANSSTLLSAWVIDSIPTLGK